MLQRCQTLSDVVQYFLYGSAHRNWVEAGTAGCENHEQSSSSSSNAVKYTTVRSNIVRDWLILPTPLRSRRREVEDILWKFLPEEAKQAAEKRGQDAAPGQNIGRAHHK